MNKILVIDDDPALADMIADFCESAGFEVKTVNHSPDAFRTAKEWKPTLITLDLEMPEMDGIEVLKQLQTDPATAAIPVVVVSVVARGALEQGLLKETRAVFEKPVRLQKLIQKLTQLITGGKAEGDPDFEASKTDK